MSPLPLRVQQSHIKLEGFYKNTALTFPLKHSLELLFLFAISTPLSFPSNEMNNDEELWNLTILYFSWHIKLKSI